MTLPLEVDVIDVAYQSKAVVHGVSFRLAEGSIGCLLGPSGCGKTTILRAIAGFEPLQSGRILLAGKLVSRRGHTVAPEKRQVGMVFQDFALFPHLSVSDNVGFGLRTWSAARRRERIDYLLDLVGLPDYSKLYPHQLSGGQQQRVALARALAPKPKLLLLDEPFASMDVDLREGLAREVRGIMREEGIAGILVSHDQMEAFAMADEIGVINEGRLVQWDTGYNLYHRPANRFVADFIGQGVLLPGAVIDERTVGTELGVIGGQIPPGCAKECPVDVLVRPDDVVHDDTSAMTGEVVSKAFRGAEFLYTLRLDSGARVLCLAHSHHNHAPGERIGIRLDADHLVMFRRDR